MPRNIIATLSIGEGDPPGISIVVRADGQPLQQGPVAPQAALDLADALGNATGDPTAAETLRGMFQPIVDGLQALVDEAKQQQQARQAALEAWQAALGPPPA